MELLHECMMPVLLQYAIWCMGLQHLSVNRECDWWVNSIVVILNASNMIVQTAQERIVGLKDWNDGSIVT